MIWLFPEIGGPTRGIPRRPHDKEPGLLGSVFGPNLNHNLNNNMAVSEKVPSFLVGVLTIRALVICNLNHNVRGYQKDR